EMPHAAFPTKTARQERPSIMKPQLSAFSVLSLCFLCVSVVDSSASAQWTTYRGNAQRTGNTDGKAGPAKAKILWVMKSKDHFIASPVPYKQRMFVSGLGFANAPTLSSLDIAPKATKRTAWSKSLPALKLPTVSSPAIADG